MPKFGVVKESEPFFDGPAGCDDETGAPMPADYEMIQISGMLAGEAIEAQVIEDEQVQGEK